MLSGNGNGVREKDFRRMMGVENRVAEREEFHGILQVSCEMSECHTRTI